MPEPSASEHVRLSSLCLLIQRRERRERRLSAIAMTIRRVRRGFYEGPAQCTNSGRFFREAARRKKFKRAESARAIAKLHDEYGSFSLLITTSPSCSHPPFNRYCLSVGATLPKPPRCTPLRAFSPYVRNCVKLCRCLSPSLSLALPLLSVAASTVNLLPSLRPPPSLSALRFFSPSNEWP